MIDTLNPQLAEQGPRYTQDQLTAWAGYAERNLFDTAVQMPDGTQPVLYDVTIAGNRNVRGLEPGTVEVTLLADPTDPRGDKISMTADEFLASQDIDADTLAHMLTAEQQGNAVADIGDVAVSTEVERVDEGLDERQKQLFAPIELVEKQAESVENSFDYLFDPMHPLASGKVESAALQSGTRRYNDNEAAGRRVRDLLSGDKIARHIIEQELPGVVLSREIATQMRSNTKLRERLAAHFLAKIAEDSYVPRRISVNTQKSANHGGYEEVSYMTSREYATLLALSMLDGSFKYSDSISDPIEIRDGEVLLGQHRAGAFRLLDAVQHFDDEPNAVPQYR